jgi:3-demethoxyubiquinol 3-hydroxylase
MPEMTLGNVPSVLPAALQAELRSSHAGETGAVWIYRGVLAARPAAAVRAFAVHHLATESEHLAHFDGLIHLYRRSLLLPAWRVAGFLTGFLPGLFGANAVYATIAAVETFVDQHYQRQIAALEHCNGGGELTPLIELFEHCRTDEVAHRDEATRLQTRRAGLMLRVWTRTVGVGSALAVCCAKRI